MAFLSQIVKVAEVCVGLLFDEHSSSNIFCDPSKFHQGKNRGDIIGIQATFFCQRIDMSRFKGQKRVDRFFGFIFKLRECCLFGTAWHEIESCEDVVLGAD